MPTVDLTATDFSSTIEDNGIVLIDFWAEWCGPCRMFAPWYEEVSQEHTDVVFAKVDTEAEQALAGSFGIRSIPTLMAFRDGILLYKEAGALPKEALGQLVDQVKALDMDDVRRQVAEDAASAGSEASAGAEAHDHRCDTTQM
ncbi:MAG: thioredoxin [Actinomycetota bacterium]|jgi:thioredoxin 1|nr:thioredoxin [Actinomycetota bacterium]MDA3023387.1 thioredoxin [Actinomycetota bacterium]